MTSALKALFLICMIRIKPAKIMISLDSMIYTRKKKCRRIIHGAALAGAFVGAGLAQLQIGRAHV